MEDVRRQLRRLLACESYVEEDEAEQSTSSTTDEPPPPPILKSKQRDVQNSGEDCNRYFRPCHMEVPIGENSFSNFVPLSQTNLLPLEHIRRAFAEKKVEQKQMRNRDRNNQSEESDFGDVESSSESAKARNSLGKRIRKIRFTTTYFKTLTQSSTTNLGSKRRKTSTNNFRTLSPSDILRRDGIQGTNSRTKVTKNGLSRRNEKSGSHGSEGKSSLLHPLREVHHGESRSQRSNFQEICNEAEASRSSSNEQDTDESKNSSSSQDSSSVNLGSDSEERREIIKQWNRRLKRRMRREERRRLRAIANAKPRHRPSKNSILTKYAQVAAVLSNVKMTPTIQFHAAGSL
mmetsp:Transcript_21313/g.52165  ORF Transcript_21313/g.52165 Transcript_21313/m.52165 type:complete len:347 (+) Transcript_21313:854-1894(+)